MASMLGTKHTTSGLNLGFSTSGPPNPASASATIMTIQSSTVWMLSENSIRWARSRALLSGGPPWETIWPGAGTSRRDTRPRDGQLGPFQSRGTKAVREFLL
jgi:hypothetical protein